MPLARLSQSRGILHYGGVAVLARDSFDRADDANTLGNAETGQAWNVGNALDAAVLPTFGIASNLAYMGAAGNKNDRHAWIETGKANVRLSCDLLVSTAASGTHSGFLLRRVDASNYLCIGLLNGTDVVRVDRNLAGVRDTPVSVSLPSALSDGQTVALVVDAHGSTVRVYVDTVLVTTYTDTDFPTGTKHGLFHQGGVGVQRWNNFRVTG